MRRGARSGWRGWSRRRRGCSRGSASSSTGRTGGAAHSPPTTTRSTARSSRSPAGPTPTWTPRSGSRSDAGTQASERSSATGSTPTRTTPTRARTSTGCTSSSGSSTATSRASRTAGRHVPALVWYEREYAEPEAFPVAWPGRWRAAAAYPVAGSAPVALVLDRDPGGGMGRLRFGPGAPVRGGRRAAAQGDGRAPRGRCRGAPAARPTAWLGTCARTRRTASCTRASRSRTASRSRACRRWCCGSARRCRSRPASSGCRRCRRAGPRRTSPPASST